MSRGFGFKINGRLLHRPSTHYKFGPKEFVLIILHLLIAILVGLKTSLGFL